MGRFRHFLLAMLFAVFAAGTAAHAAMTTEMTLALSMPAPGETGMDMPDCPGCDTDDATDMTACDLACTVPLAADLHGVASEHPRVSPEHDLAIVFELSGRTGPPALDPPRTRI